MKKTTTYSKVLRIDYNFTGTEIRDALMKAHGIPQYDPKRKRIEFEMDSDGADLILVFVEEEAEKKPEVEETQ